MSALLRWQSQLIDAITAPEAPSPLPAGLSQPGLDAYRGNARLVRVEALLAAFPVCGQIVGAEFMRGVCRCYVSAEPAASANLCDDGARMGDFLAQFAPAAELPYLADVARFEWAWHRAAWAAAADCWRPAQLAALPPEAWADVRLSRHPAANCVASPWPLGEIFACHQDNPHGDFYIDLNSGGGVWLLSRPALAPQWLALSPGQAALLEALWLNAPLGDAAQAALAVEPSLNLAESLGWLAAAGAWADT